MQQRCKHAVVATAYAFVKMSRGPQVGCPRSMRRMMSQMTCLRVRARFPQLADAGTRGIMGDTEIDFGDVEEDGRPSAYNAANIGIAIVIQHPEFYYCMAEFDNPTSPNGTRLNLGMDYSIPFKRDYHLGQCRLCANTGRPGLVGLLGGG